jgi:hypothetical protein
MKTFNLNYLVSVKYSPKELTKFEFVKGVKKTFWHNEIQEGWYWMGIFHGIIVIKLTDKDIQENCLIEGDKLYEKPYVLLKFINGEEKQIKYNSESEAIHEFKIYESNIPNPLKFNQ